MQEFVYYVVEDNAVRLAFLFQSVGVGLYLSVVDNRTSGSHSEVVLYHLTAYVLAWILLVDRGAGFVIERMSACVTGHLVGCGYLLEIRRVCDNASCIDQAESIYGSHVQVVSLQVLVRVDNALDFLVTLFDYLVECLYLGFRHFVYYAFCLRFAKYCGELLFRQPCLCLFRRSTIVAR